MFSFQEFVQEVLVQEGYSEDRATQHQKAAEWHDDEATGAPKYSANLHADAAKAHRKAAQAYLDKNTKQSDLDFLSLRANRLSKKVKG